MLGVGGSTGERLMRQIAPSLVYVLAGGIVVLRAVRVRQVRAGWSLVAAGLVLYVAGNLVWVAWMDQLEAPPIPSICGAL